MSEYDPTTTEAHSDWSDEESLIVKNGGDMDGEPYGITAVFTDGTSAHFIDADDDGYADKVVYDDDGDGEADRAFVDRDNDDILETEYIDSNHDGKVDMIVADVNEDGVIDYYGRDTDFDGDIDVIVRN